MSVLASNSPRSAITMTDDHDDAPATTATTSGINDSTTMQKGVAGRINYATWDSLTTKLVLETEEEDAQEIQEAQLALGLDGKYAHSAAEQEERTKLSKAKATKKQLDQYQRREMSLVQTLPQLLGPVPTVEEEEAKEEHDPGTTATAMTAKTVRITRSLVDAGKRVLTITDTAGQKATQPQSTTASQLYPVDTIVLTQDLSLLESHMSGSQASSASAKDSLQSQIQAQRRHQPKSYPDDAENDVVELEDPANPAAPPRSIFGLIKVFLNNLHHCTVIVKCKIITGTIEVHNCHNMTLQIRKEATVATIQADLCENLCIEFHDAPSGKNPAAIQVSANSTVAVPESQKLYWGDDADDRIYHAGVSNMTASIFRDDLLENTIQCDYIADGAIPVGNATEAEFQFVTSVVNKTLVTEKVVRAGATTGSNARAMTPREIEAAALAKKKAAELPPEQDPRARMIKITDPQGNELPPMIPPSPATPSTTVTAIDDQEPVLEIYAGMTQANIDSIVMECEQNKKRGNEAFATGEYAQAVLLYSLALDKAAELPDAASVGKGGKEAETDSIEQNQSLPLFPRDVIYANRAACFLKLGQHEKALADANMGVELNPQNVKAIFRKGLALHALGRYDEAVPILGQALHREPTNKQIQQALRFAEVRLEQEIRKRMSGH